MHGVIAHLSDILRRFFRMLFCSLRSVSSWEMSRGALCSKRVAVRDQSQPTDHKIPDLCCMAVLCCDTLVL